MIYLHRRPVVATVPGRALIRWGRRFLVWVDIPNFVASRGIVAVGDTLTLTSSGEHHEAVKHWPGDAA